MDHVAKRQHKRTQICQWHAMVHSAAVGDQEPLHECLSVLYRGWYECWNKKRTASAPISELLAHCNFVFIGSRLPSALQTWGAQVQKVP